MKRYLFVILILFAFSTNVNGQSYFAFGAHGTSFNADTKDASKVGIGFSFSISKLYLDFSTNYAKGKGRQLDFSSSYTREANKKSVSVFNVGYIFSYKKLKIIPLIGVSYINSIYEDPILFDSYYLGNEKGMFSYGLVLAYPVTPLIDITIGSGNFEIAKVGFSMKVFEITYKSKR